MTGSVLLKSPSTLSHSGITLKAVGTVKPQLDPRTVGIFEAFYSSIKPIEVLSHIFELASAGKLPPGVPIPFAFPVEALPGSSSSCASFLTAGSSTH